MRYLSIVYLLALLCCCTSAPVRKSSRCSNSTQDLASSSEFEHSFELIDDPQALQEKCAEVLFGSSLTRSQAIEVLRNSLKLLDPQNDRPVRETRLMQTARKLVQYMTGESAPVDTSGTTEKPWHYGRSTPGPDPDFAPEQAPAKRRKIGASSVAKDGAGRNRGLDKERVEALRRSIEQYDEPNNSERLTLYLLNRMVQARSSYHIVRGETIRNWALEYTRTFWPSFKASTSWLDKFKKRIGIGSRKFNRITSRAKEANKEKVESSKFAFLDQFERQRIRFHDGLIFNFDHSGFEYELTSQRTLSWVGERDTVAMIDQANKATHSYTILPTISRDGKPFGKLMICLQEPSGQFGRIVVQGVRQAEERFGNIKVVASKSGKFSAALMKEWLESTLLPPIRQAAEANPPPARYEPQPSCSYATARSDCPQDMDTEEQICPEQTCPAPTALVIGDSWGGNINSGVQDLMRSSGIEFLQIPPGTTDYLQPCDVGLFRQWKYIAKRITMQAHYDGVIKEVTGRPGILNMQSLIWNQFGAIRYRDLIKHSWRHADRTYSPQEVDGEPLRASELQFDLQPGSKCEQDDCEAFAFIKCAHCGRLLCLRHFLDRACFHEVSDEDSEELFFDDEDFDADLLERDDNLN